MRSAEARLSLPLMASCVMTIVLRTGGQDAACQTHGDCALKRTGAFCRLRECSLPERITVTCGVCEPCEHCIFHRYAIDQECPSHCGPAAGEVQYLQGLFISMPSAPGQREQELSGGPGGCLVLWRFKGTSFQRYGTAMNYTRLMLPSFTENPAEAAHSECGAPSLTTGHLDVTEPAAGGGKILTLRVPSDADAVNRYQTFTARVYPASSRGIDLFWDGGDPWDELGTLAGSAGSQHAERLLPAELLSENNESHPAMAVDVENDVWCGTLEVFDTVCKACFERVGISTGINPGTRGSASHSEGQSLFFWQMNSWGCEVGTASAPLMPSADLENQHTLLRRTSHQREAAQKGKRALLSENETEVPINVNDFPANDADWLLYPNHLLVDDHYSLEDIHQRDYQGCKRNGGGEVSPTTIVPYSERMDPVCNIVPGDGSQEPCSGCAANAMCARFRMKSQSYSIIDAERGRRPIFDVAWIPTTLHRCLDCADVPGFHLNDDLECADIDECAVGSHNCNAQAACSNTMGSFECSCNRPAFKQDEANISHGLGVFCLDVSECLEQRLLTDGTFMPPVDCGRHGHCQNTFGSYTCTCDEGFEATFIDSAHACKSKSSVYIEHAWAAGNKVGLFFSWKTETVANPGDIVSIEVEPMTLPAPCDAIVAVLTPQLCPKPSWGQRQTLFWMYAGASGCTSQMSVQVGQVGVMECHLRTNRTVSWSGQVIQQKSPGDGRYYARLYSGLHSEVVATASNFFMNCLPVEEEAEASEDSEAEDQDAETTCDVLNGATAVPGLIRPLDGAGIMKGGLLDCIPRSGTDVWGLGARCTVEVPSFAGIVAEEVIEEDSDVPKRCGDGKLSPSNNEECDDGNQFDGDGCDLLCKLEVNTACSYESNHNVTSWIDFSSGERMYQWYPSESTCIRKKCGDSKINLDHEECDDGNLDNLDGCSAVCKVERGYECIHIMQVDTDTNTEMHREDCTPFVVPFNDTLDDPEDCPTCHDLGECVFFAGTLACRCKAGFSSLERGFADDNPLLDAASIALQAQQCVDINECKYLPVCSGDSACVNSAGSFRCDCMEGYSAFFEPLRGKFEGCRDDDECSLILGSGAPAPYDAPCTPIGGICSNTEGSYGCRCAKGFNGSGYRGMYDCADIDECSSGLHNCGLTQTCYNYPSGFFCQCNQLGFERSGIECYKPGFYKENEIGLKTFGRSGKPSLIRGIGRGWPLPLRQLEYNHSAGLMQLFVNHASEQGATKWSKFTLSPRQPNSEFKNAYMHTATYFGFQGPIQALTPWQCSPAECHDCVDSLGNPYVEHDPSDGGGRRRLQVIQAGSGLLTFRSAASTSRACWTWSFEPPKSEAAERAIWLSWGAFNLFDLSPSHPYESLAICSQRSDQVNQIFYKSDIRKTSSQIGLDLGEFRNSLNLLGTYINEVELEKDFRKKDANGNNELDIDEWHGRHCINYTAVSPPPNVVQKVVAPFTLELMMNKMAPGHEYWNFTQDLFDVKFSLKYSTNESELSSIFSTKPLASSSDKRSGVADGRRLALSLMNRPGLQTVPCEVARHGLNDAYSSFDLTAAQADNASQFIMAGSWTGTCNPRVPALLQDCRVDLNVHPLSRAFQLVIGGCGGFGVTNYAAGSMTENNNDTAAPWPKKSRFLYKDLYINYGYGVPDWSGPGWKGRASIFWAAQCENGVCQSPESVVLNIFRPGRGSNFPSQTVGHPEEQFYYGCQVLKLDRVPHHSLQVRLGSRKSRELVRALELRFLYVSLYRDFNASLNAAKDQAQQTIGIGTADACSRTMLSFFNSNTSLLAEESTILSSDCSSPCFEAMNNSLSDFVSSNGTLWRQFLDLDPNDDYKVSSGLSGLEDVHWSINQREYREIKKFFIARVLHVAEFLARASLACVGNLRGIMCHKFVSNFVKSTCRSDVRGSRHVVDLTSQAIDPFNQVQTNTCQEKCVAEVESTLLNGHCCAATLSAVQRHWADFVLPKRASLDFDFGVYRCLYSPRAGGDTGCFETGPEWVTAKTAFTGSVIPGCVDGRKGMSFECAFQKCIPQALPAKCCPRLQCMNGGQTAYIGACFCKCSPPFYGKTCSERGLQVVLAIQIVQASIATFETSPVLDAMASLLSIAADRLETDFVRIVEDAGTGRRDDTRSRRRGAEDESEKPKWKTITQDQTLEFGIRIVKFASTYDAMRLVQLLLTAMEGGQLAEMMGNFGLKMSEDGFSKLPEALKDDGSAGCSNSRIEGELFCGDFYGEKPEAPAPPPKTRKEPVSLALILGPILATLFVLLVAYLIHSGLLSHVFGLSYFRQARDRKRNAEKDLEHAEERFHGTVESHPGELTSREAFRFSKEKNQRKQPAETKKDVLKFINAYKSTLKFREDETNKSCGHKEESEVKNKAVSRQDWGQQSWKETSVVGREAIEGKPALLSDSDGYQRFDKSSSPFHGRQDVPMSPRVNSSAGTTRTKFSTLVKYSSRREPRHPRTPDLVATLDADVIRAPADGVCVSPDLHHFRSDGVKRSPSVDDQKPEALLARKHTLQSLKGASNPKRNSLTQSFRASKWFNNAQRKSPPQDNVPSLWSVQGEIEFSQKPAGVTLLKWSPPVKRTQNLGSNSSDFRPNVRHLHGTVASASENANSWSPIPVTAPSPQRKWTDSMTSLKQQNDKSVLECRLFESDASERFRLVQSPQHSHSARPSIFAPEVDASGMLSASGLFSSPLTPYLATDAAEDDAIDDIDPIVIDLNNGSVSIL